MLFLRLLLSLALALAVYGGGQSTPSAPTEERDSSEQSGDAVAMTALGMRLQSRRPMPRPPVQAKGTWTPKETSAVAAPSAPTARAPSRHLPELLPRRRAYPPSDDEPTAA